MGIVSIIVPTYNERDNVEELIKRIHNSMENIGQKYEVIIVDDNSPDGTADKAEELSKTYRVKVLRRPGKLGLSSAVLDSCYGCRSPASSGGNSQAFREG